MAGETIFILKEKKRILKKCKDLAVFSAAISDEDQRDEIYDEL